MLTGIFGVETIRHPLPSCLAKYFPADFTIVEVILLISDICMILTIIQLFLSGLFSGTRVEPENRGEKNLTTCDYLQRMIPSLYEFHL